MTAPSPEKLRQKLEKLVASFEKELQRDDLRSKVLALIPSFKQLKRLGKSLMNEDVGSGAARERLLAYVRKYPATPIHGDELMVVSGIQEWARRIRELRVQFGWSIMNGTTVKDMLLEGDMILNSIEADKITSRHYVLISTEQDRDAAHRWHIANTIRRKPLSIQNRILEYLRANVGQPVTGEELGYVAKSARSWPRRTRQLRTEFGWPVKTASNGRPDLDVGVYLLEADRQAPVHDRNISDEVRGHVLRRDNYACTREDCGWTQELWHPANPRFLELHHIVQHVDRGSNEESNLTTLCNVCHDVIHSSSGSEEG